jgi:hypothetical protein
VIQGTNVVEERDLNTLAVQVLGVDEEAGPPALETTNPVVQENKVHSTPRILHKVVKIGCKLIEPSVG